MGEVHVPCLKAVYEKQQRYPATRDVLAKLMGYKGLNGASATVVSALSKYGLLEGHGDNLRVSELGQDLVLHRSGDPEYSAALRTSAFMPAFFQEMHDQYPTGLPHDHSLRAALIKRGFNPKAIDGAVRSYRDTMEFLKAEDHDSEEVGLETHSSLEENRVHNQTTNTASHQGDPQVGRRAIALPLSLTEWATLHASFPLTEAAWNHMLAVLMAMKPALVTTTEQPAPSSEALTPQGEESDDPSADHE